VFVGLPTLNQHTQPIDEYDMPFYNDASTAVWENNNQLLPPLR
jgi:hypothetical protein